MAAFRCLFTVFPRREKAALGCFVSWEHGHIRLRSNSPFRLKIISKPAIQEGDNQSLTNLRGAPMKESRSSVTGSPPGPPWPQFILTAPAGPGATGSYRVNVARTTESRWAAQTLFFPLPPRSAAPSSWILQMCCRLETHDHTAASVLCSADIDHLFSVLVSLFLPKTPSSRTSARNPRK